MPSQLNPNGFEREQSTEIDKDENFGPCEGGGRMLSDSVDSGDPLMDGVDVAFHSINSGDRRGERGRGRAPLRSFWRTA